MAQFNPDAELSFSDDDIDQLLKDIEYDLAQGNYSRCCEIPSEADLLLLGQMHLQNKARSLRQKCNRSQMRRL
jgi:hypothetical protein